MLSLRIALRYLLAKKSHTAVNVISHISVAVVAVACAAIVVVLSVFNGFSDLALSHLSVLDPVLKIVPASGKTIESADSLATQIETIPGITRAMTVIEERGLLVDGSRQFPVIFRGVPHDYDRYTSIDSAMVDGIFTNATDDGTHCASISVGVAVATELRPTAEHAIALYVPRRLGRIQVSNPATAFRGDSLLVSGVFRVNQPEYDNEHIIIPLDAARSLLDYTTEATAIEIAVDSDTDIKNLADKIAKTAGQQCMVLDRVHQQEGSFRMIEIEKWVTFMMLAFILLVASFNIVSTLSMLVLEKRDNLQTMRALGATGTMVTRIFIWQGWLIAIAGAATGIVLGVTVTLLQQHYGFITLSADPATLTITAYPVRLYLPDLLVVAGVAAFIGLVTSQITARFIRTHLS